jgi:O-antigen/teichoic acid export membrane protein
MLVNQPHGYREMGAYNAANQWYNFIVFIPLAMASAILPVLSDRLGNADVHASRNVLGFMLKLNTAIALPAAAAMSALSPYIMGIYGREYHDAWPTLIPVLFTGTVFAILTPVGDVIAASGRMWLGCLMNLGWAVAYVGTTTLLVRFGSLGLASARLLAYVLHAIWVFWFAFHLLGKKVGDH